MRFFSKSPERNEGNTFSDQLSQKVNRQGQKLANHLNRRLNSLNGKTLLFLLVLFCLLYGTYCLRLIISVFN